MVLTRYYYDGSDFAMTWGAAPSGPTLGVAATATSLRTGTETPYTFDVTVPADCRGIALLALSATSGATDNIASLGNVASIGGVAMTHVDSALIATGEAGWAKAWFLGTGLPASGTRTVSVTTGTTTQDMRFVVIFWTASADMEVVDFDKLESATATDPSLTLSTTGRNCQAAGAIWSGVSLLANITPGAGLTEVLREVSQEAGRTLNVHHQTTPSTSDFAIGYTAAADEAAFVAITVAEV